MKRYLSIFMISWLISHLGVSQEIQITNILMRGEDITVSYNLIDERLDRSYTIRLYNSIDNFIRPVEMVKGDVGVDVLVGPNKTITWKAKEELGEDFNGGIKLELKGQVYVPFVELDGFEEGMTFKRGTNNDLVWFGGRGDNILVVELYQGDQLVKNFDEYPNTGKASIVIPSSVKPGSGYRYRISDSRNRDEVVYSKPFNVQRKFPLIPKMSLFTMLGIGGYLLVDSLIPVNVPDISEPPLPPGQ